MSLQGHLPPLHLSTQGSQIWCSGSFSTTLLQGPIWVGGAHWLSRTQRPGLPVARGSGGLSLTPALVPVYVSREEQPQKKERLPLRTGGP